MTRTSGSIGGGGSSSKVLRGLVILGQSNQRGNSELINSGGVRLFEQPATRQAFFSQRNRAVTAYLPGVNQRTYISADQRMMPKGSPWCKVSDEAFDAGIDLRMYNASVGSIGLFRDVVGYPQARANNASYFRKKRPSIGLDDPGCCGQLIVKAIGGTDYIFEATEASEVYATLRSEGGVIINSSGDTIPGLLDYIYSPTLSKKATAASEPDFTGAAAIGATVMDGQVVWTNRGSRTTLGYALNQAFKCNADLGFDPFGIARRALRAGQDMQLAGVERVIVYICNGEGDANSTSAANYQASLETLTRFYRGVGLEVMIGLSSYQRGSTIAGWDALTTGINAALATFASDAGVHAGANLYQLMGTVEGQNGLSYNTTGSTADNDAHINAAAQIVAGGHNASALLSAFGSPPPF